MRRILLIGAALFALIGPAKAADSSVPTMIAGSAVSDTDLIYCSQSAGTTDRKCTPVQLATYLFGKVSGDLTCTSTGGCTVTKINGVVAGALATVTPGTGVATAAANATGGTGGFVIFGGAAGTLTGNVTGNAGTVTTNANLTGDVTSSGNATTLTNAPVIAKVLTGYTSGAGTVSATDSILAAIQKLNGNAALLAPLASPTFTGTPTAPTATVGDNTTKIATTAFVLANSAGGAVSSVTGGIGVTVSPTTGAVVISAPATVRNNTATTDTITSTDKGTIVTESNAASVAVAITTAGFASTDYFTVKNLGAGTATYTPSSGTIDGAATLVCTTNQSADLYFDGTNYKSLSKNCGLGTASAANTGTSGATLPFANGNNAFSGNNSHTGIETFGTVQGTINPQVGTTYTLQASDCGKTVLITNASAITLTTLNSLTPGCSIAVEQGGAGQITVTNGSGATFTSAHSYTKTFNAAGAIIGLYVDTGTGANAHFVLTGDGA